MLWKTKNSGLSSRTYCVWNLKALERDWPNSQMLGISSIRADHILVFLTARWAKLIQQWGVMDPTQFSFAKHNHADLTKSAALLKKLELQTMRAEMDRERLKFPLKKKDGQPDASDYSRSDAEPRYSPFHHKGPAFVGAASVPEARDALQRLAEHPSAPESETPETAESQNPNPNRHASPPNTELLQTHKNGDPMPAPPRVSSPQPERHSDPAPFAGGTANSPGAAIPTRKEAPASSRAQQTV